MTEFEETAFESIVEKIVVIDQHELVVSFDRRIKIQRKCIKHIDNLA